jgi:ABC-type amino acid transport substrate-binding protein
MLLAALILTACGSSSNNGENPVKASGVLRVGTEGVYSPFSYHDPATGQLVGYDVDVAHAVADKLGLKVEFVERHGMRSLRPWRPTDSTWSPTR